MILLPWSIQTTFKMQYILEEDCQYLEKNLEIRKKKECISNFCHAQKILDYDLIVAYIVIAA